MDKIKQVKDFTLGRVENHTDGRAYMASTIKIGVVECSKCHTGYYVRLGVKEATCPVCGQHVNLTQSDTTDLT